MTNVDKPNDLGLSYTEVREWLAERGILIDQSTIYRWVQRFLPLFGEVARK
jgi:transposase-like protein